MSRKDLPLLQSLKLSARRNLLKKHIILTGVIFSLFIISVLIVNQAQHCTASDFAEGTPFEKSFSGITREVACKKAFAVCTYYSPNPKNCRIKNAE